MSCNGDAKLNGIQSNGVSKLNEIDLNGETSGFAGFGTAAIHVGQEPERWDMNQIVPPISMCTTYKQQSPGHPKVHDYAREGNPTRDVLEENLAALEDGLHCRVFSSGMSATMSLANILNTGDHIICSDNIYGGTERYFRRISAGRHGMLLTFVDLNSAEELKAALQPKTKMVWFESPSNPLLKVVDIQAVSDLIKSYNKDIIVVLDNTFMSPYFQRPLNLGADAVVHSLTKYINGHTDVLMGAVMTNDKEIDDHLHFMQLALGAIPSPFEAFLVNRGIKTLHLRMREHMTNGLAVARFLEANSRVQRVLYPELESHPQHHIHKKQSKGMSGMISFYIKGGLEEANSFLSNLTIFSLAISLGSVESIAQLPMVMSHAMVPEDVRQRLGITNNLIRLHVGCEDKEDLINDLDQALKIAIPSLPTKTCLQD